MARIFLSYSHADEALKDELLAHMANLRREGNHIWHDRMLIAGDELDPEIKKELESADLILLLISHHFLNSYYCFEIEFKTAIARAKAGEARIIPIILDHCDWTATEIPQRLATPKDGKPIAAWPNQNEAFLDVVTQIRRALATASSPPNSPTSSALPTPFPPPTPVGPPIPIAPLTSPTSSLGPTPTLPQVPKTFTDLDKRRAADAEFQTIRSFFKKGISLVEADPAATSAELSDITSQRFAAALYRDGKLIHEIVIWRGGFGGGANGISYHLGRNISHSSESTCSGWLTIEESSEGLIPKLSSLAISSFGAEAATPTESLWNQFVSPLAHRH